MKKAFTLIELLAVIIILAIVALIATPIILDVIDEASESANLSQAYLLLDGAEQLYANSFLDEGIGLSFSDTKENDVYDSLITTGEKPIDGDLFIKSNGDVKLEVIIDGACYGKDYDDKEITKCSGIDNEGDITTGSKVEMDLSKLSNLEILPNDDDWYAAGQKIEIQTYGYSYKYCIAETVCTPDKAGTGSEIALEPLDTAHLCVDLYNGEKIISSTCSVYLIDQNQPVLTPIETDITIMEGQSFAISNYFNYSFGGSGGELLCTVDSVPLDATHDIPKGNKEIKCNAVSNSGLVTTASKTINVIESVPTPEACFVTSGGMITGYYPTRTGCNMTTNFDVIIPETIGGVTITSIGTSAFERDNLTSVVIPNTVTSIGTSAFRYNNISSVSIPDSVKTISSRAFDESNIKVLDLGEGVTTISSGVFSSNSIEKLIIPDSVTTFASVIYYNPLEIVKIGSGLKTIPSGFLSDMNIEKLVIPETVTSIVSNSISDLTIGELEILGNNTIINLYGIRDCDIEILKIKNPSGVRYDASAQSYSFENTEINTLIAGEDYVEGMTKSTLHSFHRKGIRNVVIKDSVGTIADKAFYFNDNYASSVSNLVIGNGVTSIGADAFNGGLLTSVVIPDSVTSIGESAFAENPIYNIEFGNGQLSIGVAAFKKCDLTNLFISNNVTSIGVEAFMDNNLDNVTLGTGLKAIGNYAFLDNNLSKMFIPANVTSIGTQFSSSNFTTPTVIFDGRTTAIGSWGTGVKLVCDGNKPC